MSRLPWEEVWRREEGCGRERVKYRNKGKIKSIWSSTPFISCLIQALASKFFCFYVFTYTAVASYGGLT